MQNYMLVPVFNTVVLPDVETAIVLPDLTEEEKNRLGAGGNRAVIVPLKSPVSRKQLSSDDFYGIGVLAEVTGIGMTAGGRVLHLRTLNKMCRVPCCSRGCGRAPAPKSVSSGT